MTLTNLFFIKCVYILIQCVYELSQTYFNVHHFSVRVLYVFYREKYDTYNTYGRTMFVRTLYVRDSSLYSMRYLFSANEET